MRRLWWLLLALPVVQAVPFEAELVSQHASLDGRVEGTAQVAALVLHPQLAPSSGNVHAVFDAGQAVVLRTTRGAVAPDPSHEFTSASSPERIVATYDVGGMLTIKATEATHVRLLAQNPGGTMAFPVMTGALEVGRGADSSMQRTDHRGLWHEQFNRPAWPIQFTAGLKGMPDTTSVDSPHTILVYGADAVLPNGQIIHTGAQPAAPIGGVEHHDYLVVQSNRTTIQWGTTPLALAENIQVRHEGTARLVKADGRLRIHGEDLPRQRQLVILDGTFEGKIEAGRPDHTWTLKGEVSYVAVDGVQQYRQTEWPMLVTGLTAAGLLWLIALALFRLAQFISTGRVENPLDHPKRMAILQTLRNEPGQSTMELAERHSLSRGSIRHHTSLLVAAGLVSAYREGKIPRFTLNSGSSRFIQDGVPAAKAFAAMAHTVRAAIIGQAEQGPLTYDDFCQTEHKIAQRTFRKHCKILTEAGLLAPMRTGQTRTWQLQADIQALKQHYIRSYQVRRGRGQPSIHDA